jgi:hypothetical protein
VMGLSPRLVTMLCSLIGHHKVSVSECRGLGALKSTNG